MAFCCIQQNFIRNIRVNFGIPNLLQSLDIGQQSDGFIINPLQNKLVIYNLRTSDDIEMKLRSITELDTRNKITSNKSDDDVMSETCDGIVIFQIYGQLGAIQKPDSGCIVCKT